MQGGSGMRQWHAGAPYRTGAWVGFCSFSKCTHQPRLTSVGLHRRSQGATGRRQQAVLKLMRACRDQEEARWLTRTLIQVPCVALVLSICVRVSASGVVGTAT